MTHQASLSRTSTIAGRRSIRALLRVALSCMAVLTVPSGCGGTSGSTSAPASRGSKVTLENRVTIRFTGRLRALPFDPREIRLRESSKQLAALVGHHLEVVVDVALMPEYEAHFHEALIAALQSMARDLAKSDGAYDPWIPKTIRVEYDATARRGSPYAGARLDVEGRSLTIPVNGRTGLVPDRLLHAVLEDAHADAMVQRYAGKEPHEIAAKDHLEYYAYLRGSWYDLQTGKRRGETRMQALRKAVGLHAVAPDPALRAEIRDYATKEAASRFPLLHARGLAAAQPDEHEGDTARAIAAYADFVRAHEAELDDRQRLLVAQTLYVTGPDRRPVPEALPGIDAFEFALRIVDAWIARGATYEGADPAARALMGYVVCHHPRNHSDGLCRDKAFYRWAWGVEGGRRKLANALMERKRREWVEATAYAVNEPLELWRLLEDDRTTWRMLTKVIGEEYVHRSTPWVQEEVERLWRERPGDRGALLFLLARSDPDGYDEKLWGQFTQRYGSRVGQRDFADLLEFSLQAWSSLGGVFRVLDRSAAPGEVIASRMDAYLDTNPRNAYGVSLTISQNLCKHAEAGDRAAMHRYWTTRLANHPSQRAVLELATARMKPGGCRR
jgi:hypothetical protein